MRKVLYITTVNSTINAFLIDHIKMLIENGYEIDCASYINQDVNEELVGMGVNTYNITFNRNPLNLSNIKAFKELCKLQYINKYDIIHVHTPVAGIFGRMLKIIFPNIKTIYTAHGYHFMKNGSKLGWLIYYPIEKVMGKFTDVIININKEDFEITKNKIKPKRCYLINGVGIDLNKYKRLSVKEQESKRRELNLKSNDFIITMIAELNENKNHIQLIKALEILKDKYDDIKALCIGDGPKLKELKGIIESKELKNKVVFLGFRNDINEIINISNIGVLLSFREGLPRSVMEFMANGKKVIVTDIRGNKDLVVNNNVGCRVKVNDYEETAKKIEEYYIDNKKQFIKNKCEESKIIEEIKPYDIKNVLDKLKTIYRELNEG